MAFLDTAKEFVTQKLPNFKKPHFYKNDSDAITELQQLKEFNKTTGQT